MKLSAMRLAVKKAGVRWTIQRESIVRTFIRERRHLTAEELHDIVKSGKDASVSVVFRLSHHEPVGATVGSKR